VTSDEQISLHSISNSHLLPYDSEFNKKAHLKQPLT